MPCVGVAQARDELCVVPLSDLIAECESLGRQKIVLERKFTIILAATDPPLWLDRHGVVGLGRVLKISHTMVVINPPDVLLCFLQKRGCGQFSCVLVEIPCSVSIFFVSRGSPLCVNVSDCVRLEKQGP